MKRLLILLFTILFVITGCQLKPKDKEGLVQQYALKMPENMPEDFDFSITFGYGEINKNEINTYEDTVTKDLIVNGTATTNIAFDLEEKRQIYDKMKELNVMGIQDLMPVNQSCARTPYNEDVWRITVDGNLKIISWSDKNCDITNDANRLLELRKFIQHMVEQKDAYQALPAAEGGYD